MSSILRKAVPSSTVLRLGYTRCIVIRNGLWVRRGGQTGDQLHNKKTTKKPYGIIRQIPSDICFDFLPAVLLKETLEILLILTVHYTFIGVYIVVANTRTVHLRRSPAANYHIDALSLIP